MDDGAAAGGTGMCRVRRSVRPDEGGEGIREADGLPGEKTFGLMFNKKRVFPKSLAQARRAGETPSRATPSHSMGKAAYGALLRKSPRRLPLLPGDAFSPATGL